MYDSRHFSHVLIEQIDRSEDATSPCSRESGLLVPLSFREASSNKCIASSNRCIATSNNKLVETRIGNENKLLVTSALLVVTISY